MKFWDLSNQHCFKTLAGHVTEVWDLVLLQGDSLLLTGGADMELRLALFKSSVVDLNT